MPKMTPHEFTKKWQERLRKSYRSKRRMVLEWRILSEFYEGRYFAEKSLKGRVPTNLLFSIVRQKMSTLYFQNPTMFFKGESEIGAEVAPIMEEFMVLVRRIIDAESQERNIVLDGLLYGTGILKHGYNAEFSIETPLADDTILKKLQKQGQLPALNMSEDDLELSQGIFSEHDLRVRGGYPWVKSISPYDYLVDSEAMDFSECRWKGHHFWRPYADVIRDGRYDEEARVKLKPSGRSSFSIEEDRSHPDRNRDNDELGSDDSSMVSLYEIWDAENGQIIVIPDTDSRPLLRVPDPLGLVDGPYEELVFYSSNEGPWGLSDAATYAPLVEVINKINTDMLDHLSRYGKTRGIYNSGVIQTDEIQNLVNSENGELIGVNWPQDQSLGDAIEILPQETISADAWRLGELFRSFIDEVSGVNENARGGSASTETATEASIINEQGGMRARDQIYQVTRVLRRSTRRLVEILKKFWPAERVIPIVGPDGIGWNYHLTKDQVMSAYEVDIEPGSTESFNSPVRTRQIIDAMPIMAGIEPWLNRQGAGFNWIEVSKAYLKAINLSNNPEKFLILPQPDQQAAQGQNILPFTPGQQQGAAAVNALGQTPAEGGGFESGRLLSEAGAV